jgi:hypothetical protein
MPEFRLFYFRESRLERWSIVDAPDHLQAIQEVSGQGSDLKIEVWQGDKRYAVIRPTRHSAGHGRPARRAPLKPSR